MASRAQDPGAPTLAVLARQAVGLGKKHGAAEVAALARERRSVEGSDAFVSVTGSWSDTVAEEVRVTSNGFDGSSRQTYLGASVQVSARDSDGRRPEAYAYAGSCWRGDLPRMESIGAEAARR